MFGETTLNQNITQPIENPLTKHFRTPAIQIKLPSDGKFWPINSIEQSPTKEYPVYPMTAKDEIIFNNPDALMNGQAVVDVIHSCMPSIKNAWEMPSIDLDHILIAIRIASYGEVMDFSSKCPKCDVENTYGIDLHLFTDRNIDISDFNESYEFQGLSFTFKPQNYMNINELNIEQFEGQQFINNIINAENITEEEKVKQVNELYKKMSTRTIKIFANAIRSITTPDDVNVTDQVFIMEFLENCDRKVFKFIEQVLDDISKKVSLSDIDMKCAECEHEYKIPFSFDNANFFGEDS